MLLPITPLAIVAPVHVADDAKTHADAAIAFQNNKEFAKAVAEYTLAIQLDATVGAWFVNRGYCNYQLSQYDAASADYTEGLSRYKPSETRARAIALVNRGDIFRMKANWEKALDDVDAALLADPSFPYLYRLRAQTRYEMGDYSGAVSDLAEGKKRLPTLADLTLTAEGAAANRTKNRDAYRVFFQRGVRLNTAKDFTGAYEAFSTVIRITPNVPGAYINRGQASSNLKKTDDAISDYTTAIEKCGNAENFLVTKAVALSNRGAIYYERADYARALSDFDASLVANPSGALCLRNRALTHYQLGDYDRAVADYDKARALDTKLQPLTLTRDGASANRARREAQNDPKALLKLVRQSILDGKNIPAAIADLDRLTAKDPSNAEAWYLRGLAEEKNGSSVLIVIGARKEAVPFYDKAIAADSSYADAYWRRAKIALSDFGATNAVQAQARADLDLAVKYNTQDPEAYARHADQRDAKDTEGRIADLSRAVALSNGDSSYIARRSSAYAAAKDWKKAIADRDVLIAKKPFASDYASRADYYTELREWTTALADYEKALALEPDNADHYLGRAALYRRKGEKALALADYVKAHALDPDVPVVSSNLDNATAADANRRSLKRIMARINKSSKDLTEAVVAQSKAEAALKKSEARLTRLLSGDKRTPDEVLKQVAEFIASGTADEEDYLDRARIHGDRKEFDKAIADCTQSIAIKPDAEAYNLRGICYELISKLDEALADYDKAIAMRSSKPAFRRNRGDVYYTKKRFAEALSDYEEAAKIEPKNAINFFKRGNTQFMLGKLDLAIADYDKALELQPEFPEAKRNREIALKKKAAAP